jgi:hypothetical protein
MKKTTKTTKSTKATKTTKPLTSTNAAQKQLEKELSKIGLSVDEANDWLKSGKPCGQANCSTCGNIDPSVSDIEYANYINSTTNEEAGNVSFIPGATAEETLIYVGETLLRGVTKATLEYDAELGVPLLKLEILGVSLE